MGYESPRGYQYTKLRKSIRGQYVTIQNLFRLLPDWQPNIHQDYSKAREESLNPWLRRWVDDDTKCWKLQKADFALFAAILCSKSSFEKLCTVAKYFAWYFVWDDIFDCGTLKDDPEEMKSYRKVSLAYFNHTLLLKGEYPDLSGFPVELQKALRCWDEVGEHIRQDCDIETRQILLDRMLAYVASVSNVDSLYLGNELPSLEAYWRRRELTAAAYCVIATIPFACGFNTNRSLVEDENMTLLWKHTSYLVHIINDMMSFRKEFNDGQLENLVPILMANTGLNCNQAMQLCYHFCRLEIDGFTSNAKRLSAGQKHQPSHIVATYIRGCEDVFMGLLYWSYYGERYIKRSEIDPNHTVRLQVGSTLWSRCNANLRRIGSILQKLFDGHGRDSSRREAAT
ncbi:terpene synthase family protein [Aspergillus lucknowensis]|uniref:Terpene synthase n=1 Tax=Aspergillus lucknowensis TaxID=176173 RepID=A0ABR4LTC3_9EURO